MSTLIKKGDKWITVAGGTRLWTGTSEQLKDALEAGDLLDYTTVMVTDDYDASGSSAATKELEERVAALESEHEHVRFQLAKGWSDGKGGFWDDTGSYMVPEKFENWLRNNGYPINNAVYIMFVDGQENSFATLYNNGNDTSICAAKGGYNPEMWSWVNGKGYRYSTDSDCQLEVVIMYKNVMAYKAVAVK